MAARSACAARRPDAVSRHLDGGSRERPAISNRRGGIPRGASKARMGGRPKYSDRSSLGRVQRGDAATLLQQTRTVPIVFATVADPVGSGFVASFARPGGNATGFAVYEASLGGKWLELLKETVPSVSRAVVIFNPATAPFADNQLKSINDAAASFGVEVSVAHVPDVSDLETVVATQARE